MPYEKDITTRQAEFEPINIDNLLHWGHEVLPQQSPVVLPFSGGLDSATLAAFLVQIVGPQNVLAIHVEHSTTQPQETTNAKAVADQLGIHFTIVDLHDLQTRMGLKVDEVLASLGHASQGSMETTSNASMVYAITREVTRRTGGRLCGTLDGSEILTGYFPKESFYGDFLPLGGLLRTEVRSLSQVFNLPPLPEQFAVVPGCGSIVEFVNTQAGTNFASEIEIDYALLQFLSNPQMDDQLENFCIRMSHKAVSALHGRPIYYPSEPRRLLLITSPE